MNSRRRRTFLRLAGSAAIVGLAGCSGDGTGGEEGNAGGNTARGGSGEGTSGNGGQAPEGGSETETSAVGETGSPSVGTETGGGQAATTKATDLSGPVPNAYRTATSLGGSKRNPDSLQSKSAVQYQSQPNDDQQCSACMFYIPDKNNDGLGACSIVEGFIQPEGWCISFSPQNG